MGLTSNIETNLLQELESIGLRLASNEEKDGHDEYKFLHRDYVIRFDLFSDKDEQISCITNVFVNDNPVGFEYSRDSSLKVKNGIIVVYSLQDFVSLLNRKLMIQDGL